MERLGVIRDKDGEVLRHRTILKMLCNPILRRFFKCSIVSKFEDNEFIGYQVREYPKYCRVLGKDE